jgi:hypothetical protein
MMLAWALSGFGATVVLTALFGVAQGLGWTRMSLPVLLGTMFTPDRDRARLVGNLVHLANGWILSAIYFAVFSLAGAPSAGLGALVGLVHGVFVGAVGLPALPAFHPRVARPQAGPTAERRLEPPASSRHYGWSTGAVIVAGHVVFGALLGIGAGLAR